MSEDPPAQLRSRRRKHAVSGRDSTRNARQTPDWRGQTIPICAPKRGHQVVRYHQLRRLARPGSTMSPGASEPYKPAGATPPRAIGRRGPSVRSREASRVLRRVGMGWRVGGCQKVWGLERSRRGQGGAPRPKPAAGKGRAIETVARRRARTAPPIKSYDTARKHAKSPGDTLVSPGLRFCYRSVTVERQCTYGGRPGAGRPRGGASGPCSDNRPGCGCGSGKCGPCARGFSRNSGPPSPHNHCPGKPLLPVHQPTMLPRWRASWVVSL